MSFLPAPIDDGSGVTARQLSRAKKLQADTELTIFRYSLEARTRAEVDRIDSQAIGDASRAALDEEMDLLDYGMSRVNGSATKVELLQRHVERMSRINNARLSRRFGG
jgi:hypothetical protein